MNHADFLALRRFDGLDGLRALGVLVVIWQHTSAHAFADSPLSYVGGRGVILFFAISGFLITTLLLRERDRHGRIDLRAFYVRRSLRIFPLFYATLLLYVVAVWVLDRHSDAGRDFFRNLPAFATYTSNWFVELKDRTIFYFAWSLAAEEQYYLVWPALLVAAGTRRRALAVVVAAAVGVLVIDMVLASRGDPEALIARQQRVPLAIVAGSLLAVALHGERGYRMLAPWLSHPLASLAFAGMAVAFLWIPSVPESATHLVSALLVASVCTARRHVLEQPLTWRPLAYVGTISYGIYLLHLLPHHATTKLLPKLGIGSGWAIDFVVTTLLAIAIAAASWRWFESPLLTLKQRYVR